MDTLYCIVIEHLDASVSANGPYESYASARLACYAIAEYEAEQLDTIYKHESDGSQVGDDESGEDTMSLYVQPLGQPLDTSDVNDVRVGKYVGACPHCGKLPEQHDDAACHLASIMIDATHVLTSMDGAWERVVQCDGDNGAILMAYERAIEEGLKTMHVFRLDEERWFVKLTLP